MDFKEQFAILVEQHKYEDARILLEQHSTYASEDPFYYANMGWLYNHMERFQEAEILLRKGLTLFPDEAWMHSQLGFALDRQGKVEEGLESLQKALNMGFDEPWLHGEIGWCYKELKEYHKAIEYYENGLLDEPDNLWLLSQAAYMYLAVDQMDTAEEYFLKTYRLHKDVESVGDLVYFYKHKGDFEQVITYLKTLPEGDHEDWRAFELGVAYNQLGKYELSLPHLKKALALGRDDTSVRSQLADSYLYTGHNEEANESYNIALSYYEKALKKEEEHYWIYQEMIWIAHKQRDFQKKLEYLDRACKEREPDLWMMYHYSRVYSDLYDHVQAINACKFCMEHGEDSKEMYDLYAWNLGRADREQEAIELLEKRVERYGSDEWTDGEIGWDYAQLQDYDKALAHFYKAVDLNPDNPLHLSMLAWCLLRKEDYAQAYAYAIQAQEKGRNDGWLHSVLGEIHTGLHQVEKAIEEYQKALQDGYDEEWIHEELEKLHKQNQSVQANDQEGS